MASGAMHCHSVRYSEKLVVDFEGFHGLPYVTVPLKYALEEVFKSQRVIRRSWLEDCVVK